MRNLSSILFITGLVIEAIAFFIGYAESVPFVYRIISPAYYHANKGVDILSENRVLEPNDDGFQEIERLFKTVAQKQNPPEVINSLSALQFLKKNAAMTFSKDRAKEVISVEVKLSNGQSVNWDLNEISDLASQLKSSSLFYWALAIFLFGILIQVIGFRLGQI